MSLPRSLAVPAAIVVLAALPAPALAKKCGIAKPGSYGVTYVTSITVTKVGCAAGNDVVRAYHKCRKANGVSGRCVKKVLGYACQEQRTTGPVQFSGKVTCAKGKKRVVHTYTQNT